MPHELRKQNFLHIEDLYKGYGEKVILDNIDLSVEAGTFATVVGPSGCGKSTLLRLILGQEKPDRGDLLIDQRIVGPANTMRGIVYQKYSLFPNMSVMDNVLLGFKLGMKNLWSREPKACKHEAEEYLNKAKLWDARDKYPHELSGGMQQRVAVMQALIMKPKILLMDEPFGALDPGTREDLQNFVLQVWQEHNMTIFFVTHDLEEAVYLGTRLIVLSQYYTDDRGLGFGHPLHGAKIVADHDIRHKSGIVAHKAEKLTAEFSQLIEEIRTEGFDPRHLQHVKSFKLNHVNSFQTLTTNEYSQ